MLFLYIPTLSGSGRIRHTLATMMVYSSSVAFSLGSHSPIHLPGESVWGRGSMDDKSGLIGLMYLLHLSESLPLSFNPTSLRSSVESLLEYSFRPTRTVVLAFGFDEESGPVHVGSRLLL